MRGAGINVGSGDGGMGEGREEVCHGLLHHLGWCILVWLDEGEERDDNQCLDLFRFVLRECLL